MKKFMLLAACAAAFAVTLVGAGPAAASVGITVDESVSGGNSPTFTIDTSQPNELILISVNGWPCVGGQEVSVDGLPATLVAAAGDCGGLNTGGATVFQFVAPTAGTHNVSIDNQGGFNGFYTMSYAVSLLNASSTGGTSATSLGTTAPSITTSSPNQYVFATSTLNNGGGWSPTWTGSPVTPTLLQSGTSNCCGLDSSIAGFTAPTPGSYSAILNDSSPYVGQQANILVAVPASVDVDALFDALQVAVTGEGPGKSLADKVALAKSYADANDLANACLTMDGFISEVNAQTGKKISLANAASFIAQAEAIKDALGC